MLANATRQGGDGRRTARAPGRDVRLPRAALPVVLFVEDNTALRYTVAAELRDAGYVVVEATTGEEAVAQLSGSGRIDVLLTDLRLPGRLDGWDIAERARGLRPGVPVIYASAYSYASPRQVAGSLMLHKPYPPEALLDALDALLD